MRDLRQQVFANAIACCLVMHENVETTPLQLKSEDLDRVHNE